MRQVLADAALEREGFRRGGRRAGRIGVEHDVAVDAGEQRVQQPQRLVAAAPAHLAGEGRDRGIRRGQRRRAQKQAGREMLDRAAHDARGCPGSRPRPRPVRRSVSQRPVGGEGVGDVAEGILLRVEPAVRRYVDAPVDHVLAVVIARRHAQRLDHAFRRLRRSGRSVSCETRMRMPPSSQLEPGCPPRHRGLRSAGRPGGLPAHMRYCSLTAAPSWLLSAMNSPMNSCRPRWKISSMRLFCSRVRTARAWRCAGPWRP